MTPHRRRSGTTDRGRVIARAAAKLAGEEHPVLVEVSLWLTDVARAFADVGEIEADFAMKVARAALTGKPVVSDAELPVVGEAAGVVPDGGG